MELKLNTLNVKKERVYFYIMLIFSILIWALIAITIVGPIIGLLIAFFAWLGNGLLVAHLKSNCVHVDEKQLPDLFATFKDVCEKFNIPIPELYILQSQGVLNAYAMRHSGRDFVVLNSDLIDELDFRGDEIRFLLGHEIGHIKSKHIVKQIAFIPASWIPLLAPAYHRACETSCDRYGAFSVNSADGAVRALAILASGRKLIDHIDANIFSEQFSTQRGFFISWHELISSYPTLSHRVANILAIKNKQTAPTYNRNPLAYVFALFSFGGGGANGGNFMIIVAVIALLAAIAIPNLLRAKISANDALASATLRTVATASETYAKANGGYYPNSIDDLTDATPAYLNYNYCNQTISGYIYSCVFDKSGYQITATPVTAGTSGTTTLTVTTGEIIIP